MEADPPVTAVAAIVKDIRGLCEAAEVAAVAADWDAVERLENIRHSLLNTLGELAANPRLRVQAAEAFRQVQAFETPLGAAIYKARNAQNITAGRAIHSRRAGQVYTSVGAA